MRQFDISNKRTSKAKPQVKMVRLNEAYLNRAIGMIQSGTSQRRTADILGVSISQVNRAWLRYQTNNSPNYTHGGGRQRATTAANDRYIVRRALLERTLNATQLQQQFEQVSGIHLSTETIRSRLRNAGVRNRRPARHPKWTRDHRRNRLRFGLEHQNWDDQDWDRCLFSDESRFCLYPDSRKVRVWRRQGERYNENSMIEYVPYGGNSLMIWAGISTDFRTELVIFNESMTANLYLERVLQPVVLPIAQNIGPNFVYVDDNARPHRARIVNDFIHREHINRMYWPALSPDINPIERIWDALQRRISSRRNHPQNLNQLENALVEEWARIPVEIVNNTIRSMHQRCEEIVRSRGGPTHY